MSALVCIPVHRVKCQVLVDEGRAWTPVEELILWGISRKPLSIAELANEAGLSHQIVVAAVSRLMRFRLAKLAVVEGAHKFAASASGAKAVASGDSLPYFPKRSEVWISFVLEHVTGQVLRARDVCRIRERDLEGPSGHGQRIVLSVTGTELDITHEAMVARIDRLVARGREQKLAAIVAGTATMSREFIGVAVQNGVVRDLPEQAGPALRKVVIAAAGQAGKARSVAVPYAGQAAAAVIAEPVSCDIQPEDIVLGGSAQGELLRNLLGRAASRMVIHSTFIDYDDFTMLLPDFQAACRRDVEIDILWGAAHGEDAKSQYAATAARLAALVRTDLILHRRLRIWPQSTGSHSKLLLLDSLDGGWIGVVSSCNWLKSQFRSVEISTVLRHPRLVAGIATALQKMAGARGLADELANEMAILSGHLKSQPGKNGSASVSLITGTDHDAILRAASRAAKRRFMIGMHKLGATARPGALLPAEAASKQAREVQVLYTNPSGPLKNRHARELQKEAAEHGIRLLRMNPIPLHGKFLLWDDDNVVTSSLNWGSASSDPEFPLGDIGVHVTAPSIASSLMDRLVAIFPKLKDGAGVDEAAA